MAFEFYKTSATEQLLRIEFELKVFPLVVMLRLEHGERLAQQQRALGALGERRSERRRGGLDQHTGSRDIDASGLNSTRSTT